MHTNEPELNAEKTNSEIDEAYWKEAKAQHRYFKPEISFDRYRWALRYGQMARQRHGVDVTFEQIEADLRAGWSEFGGASQLTWDEAAGAIRAAWEYKGTLAGENMAQHGQFSHPPTFTDQGDLVPRGRDEPNR